jgi:23S rRNA (uracil1939-C5)-methyltransferase
MIAPAASPDSTHTDGHQPPCPYFQRCGGCASQDLPYSEQLYRKETALRKVFAPWITGAQPTPRWLPYLATPGNFPLYYRNKIRYGFTGEGGKVRVSRHAKGEEAADIAVDSCLLQSAYSLELAAFVADWAHTHAWSIDQPGRHSPGWLKHCLIREGKYTGQSMLALVTAPSPIPDCPAFVVAVRRYFPELSSLYQITLDERGRETSVLLDGDAVIRETVGPFSFQISPLAFFQTNSLILPSFYDRIAEIAAEGGSGVLWDLYAGSATIGIYLSRQFRTVASLETNQQNIADARANIGQNNISNLEIFGASVESLQRGDLRSRLPVPDTVIVDPPRSGLSAAARRLLLAIRPPYLVYVSCNPETCARDCKEFTQFQYRLTSIRGIDCFPHTLHQECVVSLVRTTSC